MRFLHRPVLAALLYCSFGLLITSATSQDPPGPSAAGLELAAHLIETNGDPSELIAAYRDRIDIDLRRGLTEQAGRLMAERRFADALRGYELAHQVAEQIGDRRGAAAALLGIGTIHGRLGEYAEAALSLRQGLAIDEEINDGPNTEVALNNLGIVRRLQGEYEEAIDYYRRALTLAERLGRPANAARTLTNIGIVQMLRGSYREALQYFQQSLQLKETMKQNADIPSTLESMGTVYKEMGDADLALEYYRRAEKVNEQLGRLASPAVLNDLGRMYADQRQYDLALDYYRRALARYEAEGSQAEVAATLQNYGSTRRARGDLNEAMSDFQRSLAIRERINDRHGAADTLLEIAATLRIQANPSAALDIARKAVRLARETGGRETLWRARLQEGESHEALGEKSAAREAYAEAVDLVEQLRGDAAGGEQERQRFLEGRLAPFQRLAGLFAGEGRAAEALGMTERAKARVMLDVLRAGRADITFLTLEERERQRQIERDMTAVHARLQAEEGKEAPDERVLGTLRDAWRKARLAEAEFRTKLYDAHPALKLSRGDEEPGSLEDAAVIVDAGTALLEFMVAPDTTYLFVVTRDSAGGASLACFTIDITEDDLRRAAGRFRDQLAGRDLDIHQTARDLYRLLMAPAEAKLRGKTNFIIVPDGPLWEVAFQALEPGPKRYLVEDAAISVAPSIAVLREIRAKRARVAPAPAPTLVALGDPSLAFTPNDRLPDAARQVHRLQQVYGAPHSQIFVGDAASEQRFVSVAGGPTVLHLATHGVIDDNSPMYSFLMLAGDPKGEAARDGRLEAWEIMKLNLHADVTVLASCETARGRIGAGEGVIGLAWAFFLAGSPRTVVSLWKVDAESTTDLMLAFHRQLRIGLTRTPGHPGAAASLRAAALSLMRDPRYRHPFYWAGFLVIGDGS